MEIPATPNVFIAKQQTSFINPPVLQQPSGKGFNLKYVFLIFGVVIIIELFLGIRALLQPVKPKEKEVALPVVSEEASGKFTLEAPQKEYRVGELIPVSVNLNVGNKMADGADLVLKFDPNKLDSAPSITKGSIFPEYPVVKSDGGEVRMTAITSLGGGSFSGSGIFATIIFRAKAVGSTSVSFDFTPGSTTDSNIFGPAGYGDMLKEVGNLEVNIR